MSINSDESPSSVGRKGEDIACVYLSRCLGWSVVDRNFKTRSGELDVVAYTPGRYVFVEVKTRRTHRFGVPLEAVTPIKVARLMQQIHYYSRARSIDLDRFEVCLDVVGLILNQGVLASVQHVRILP
ncbi:YraN family protein [Alicyclobacillus fastidiosus]|uniref:UPF0102 protein KKP3000_001692 n=1 Tax=Alicyclobacillus fastidiosus TaxID=392011 RepID=A0ABV5AJN7_9BACL|nr:YraN family protein [Alicyclobacillus fastidiosus]WEH08026.1 YraN family protein [Alicyclobacillus fastidiosus]